MNKLAVLMLTAALAACSAVPPQQASVPPDTRTSGAGAAPEDTALRGGHATPDGAAFLGFHGPVHRMNQARD